MYFTPIIFKKLLNRFFSNSKTYPVVCNLTKNCNLTCRYCNMRYEKNKNIQLSAEKWFEIIEKLYELNFTDFIFHGGEPFLYPELEEVVNFAVEKGFVSVVTNGTLLTKKNLKKVRRVNHLIVSVDNLTPIISEKNCVRSFNLLYLFSKKFKIPIEILSTITPTNLKEVLKIIDITQKYNFHVRVQIVHLTDDIKIKFSLRRSVPGLKFDKKDVVKLIKFERKLIQLKRLGYRIQTPSKYISYMHKFIEGTTTNVCKAGEKIIAIDNDGKIKPCVDLPSIPINILDLNKIEFKSLSSRLKKFIPNNCRCFYACYYSTSFLEWLNENIYDIP
ncbi:MAG: radical SAM protein [Candidatus Aenigmatarchaeota archaeon]